MMDLKTARKIIEQELEKYPFDNSPAELYEPVKYIISLGGKRLRPAIALMACSIFSDAVHNALKPALAFEVFHNFTLLHDDLMDNSGIRRGNKTVHTKWNSNTAILSGDVMSILAYTILSESPQDILPDLLQLFNTTALQVCEGQQWDMNFESRSDVSVEEYLRMIELKTAVLLAASLKSGALAGGASQLESDLLYEFGRHLGIAFQIRDDYLDVFGNTEVFGKKIGNDILTDKKTFLLIKALELSVGKTREDLLGWLEKKEHDPIKKIKGISQIFSSLEVDRISTELASSHYEQAMQYLERVDAPAERKTPMAEMAKTLMAREK